MSALTWKDSLEAALALYRRGARPLRLAVVGVGNEMRGDDAAGVMVVRALRSRLGEFQSEGQEPGAISWFLFEGATAPENATARLRRIEPDLILFVDAADMDKMPGTVRWLEAHDSTGFTGSTHMFPLHLLAEYLESELGCGVALVGIQPESVELNASVSEPVERGVNDVTNILMEVCFERGGCG